MAKLGVILMVIVGITRHKKRPLYLGSLCYTQSAINQARRIPLKKGIVAPS